MNAKGGVHHLEGEGLIKGGLCIAGEWRCITAAAGWEGRDVDLEAGDEALM